MNESMQREVWAGLDWGDEKHSVVVVDANTGTQVKQFEVKHTATGLDELIAGLLGCGKILGVAVESRRHMVVMKLLQANIPVYPINPKVSKMWVKCEKPQESATDESDADVLARNLRNRQNELRVMKPDDEQTRQLAMICADECALIEQRTALVAHLIATLKVYHPQALEWFADWTLQSAWDLILTFPTPEAFRTAKRKQLTGFLKVHRIGLTELWRKRIDEERFAAYPWPFDKATEQAKSLLAISLCKQLRTLEAAITEYRDRINKLFAEHPDHDIFSSLPGAGPKLGPRLLRVFGANRSLYETPKAVQQINGVVPVTIKSGKEKKVAQVAFFRHACNKEGRRDLHLFAMTSLRFCAWANAFYHACRERGQGHNEALRNLAVKWTNIIFRMWQDRTSYDEGKYLTSMITHGSPLILRMQPSAKA